MEIHGLMRLTLLDYPGKIACTVFTGGCDFQCPFCHNSPIVLKKNEALPIEEVFEFLFKRRGILDGVCITGGEPLVDTDVIAFMGKVKSLGYSVKLDTNGSHPRRLEQAINSGFCDYIAMDLKNSPKLYPQTIGVADFDTDKILQSIDIIRRSGVNHEFRTTVVRELHSEESIRELAMLIPNEEHYFIQNFRESENVLAKGLTAFNTSELSRLLEAAKEFIPKAELRGV